MFSSLRARLWLSYALLIVTALMVVAIVLIGFLLGNPLIYRQIYARLQAAQGLLTAQPLPAGRIGSVAQALDVRVILFNSSGVLLEDSGGGTPALYLPARTLIPRASAAARDASGRPWLYSLKRLPDGTWLLIAAPRPKILPALAVVSDELTAPLLEGGLFALLLSLVLAFVIAGWVADPLQALIAAARTMPAEATKTVPETGPREIRELTRSFNAMVGRVQASQTSQRDFVANVSHELKTPLTSIEGFAQAILDGTAHTDAARRQAASVIYNEASRMHRMAVNLLDLARLDAGTANLQMSAVALKPLLAAIIEKFAPMAAAAGITLRLMTAVKLPELIGDGDRLAQVFTNLVDNALKFTPRGGTVEIEAIQDKGEMQVSVNDSGSGIPAAAVPHIFERFYRADFARPGGDGHGAGLGLAIAQEIVAAHGGRITVRSEEGRGTGFVVHLPLGPAK